MKAETNTYRFGFLDRKISIGFHGGRIAPLPTFDRGKTWVAKYAHKDGFIYPPSGRLVDKNGKTRPNTERPSLLHRLPASHELLMDGKTVGDRHRHGASTVMHLLGFICGTFLQFEDWWFSDRVPLNNGLNALITDAITKHFLAHSYAVWQTWKDETRNRFKNLLYMLNRATAYEWDWEHFLIEYMVFDACCKTAADLKGFKSRGKHGERFRAVSDSFGLYRNDALTGEFVRLRNDLFHEALWEKSQPGTAASVSSFFAPMHLRRLNQRFVLALLNYNNNFVRTDWSSLGTVMFKIP